MPRYESEGTWFSAEERAKRERRAHKGAVLLVPDRLRDLHAKLDRRGVSATEAMCHLQEYHALVGELLAPPAKPKPGAKGFLGSAYTVRTVYKLHGL